MREHNHYPVKGGAIYRTMVFIYAVVFHRIVNWNTETASCYYCGKLLRIPKAAGIAPVFVPFVWVPSYSYFAILLKRNHLPEFLIIIIGVVFLVVSLILIHALFVSLCMAFGKWIAVEQHNQSMDQVNVQLRKIIHNRKKKQAIAVSIATVVSFIITMIILTN